MKPLTIILITTFNLLLLVKPTYVYYTNIMTNDKKLARLPLWKAIISYLLGRDIFRFEIVPWWKIKYNNQY